MGMSLLMGDLLGENENKGEEKCLISIVESKFSVFLQTSKSTAKGGIDPT
jgi:hypothetical protein